MKLTFSYLVAAAFFVSSNAGGTTMEQQKCPPPVTMWRDVITETVTRTVTSTYKDIEIQTKTEVDIQYQKETKTEVDVQYQKETYYDTQYNTQYITSIQTCEPIVKTDVKTTTVYPDADTVTVTVATVSTVSEVVTVTDCPAPPAPPPPPPPPPPPTGLVLCPSRKVNPTYTPKEPVPTGYHWGCPPDTLCTPPQIDCNFERAPPEDTYFCAPEECVPTRDLPAYIDVTGDNPTDTDYAWYTPPPGYFNLNPEDFDLTYKIFDIYGQPVCEAPSQHWGDSGWHDWHSGKPPHLRVVRGTNNPLARLQTRQAASEGPPECFSVFNAASLVGQNAYSTTLKFCPPDTRFQKALGNCRECADNHAASGLVDTFPALQIYLNWCEENYKP